MKSIVLSVKLPRCVLELATCSILVLINMVSCELWQWRRWALLWGRLASKQRNRWVGEAVTSETALAGGVKTYRLGILLS